jgi:prophage regulatory protein
MTARTSTEAPIVKALDIQPTTSNRTLNGLDEVIFFRLPEVRAVTGVSKSSLYALIRSNGFPSPVRLGPRTVGWLRSEVSQWAAERVYKSRLAGPLPVSKRPPQRARSERWAASK